LQEEEWRGEGEGRREQEGQERKQGRVPARRDGWQLREYHHPTIDVSWETPPTRRSHLADQPHFLSRVFRINRMYSR
ncbi:hypothetical protein PMAYCL1PPCAC_01712, partial [Pristionchus mayeri]